MKFNFSVNMPISSMNRSSLKRPEIADPQNKHSPEILTLFTYTTKDGICRANFSPTPICKSSTDTFIHDTGLQLNTLPCV